MNHSHEQRGRLTEHIPGFTSTGSKAPEILFGELTPDLPSRMVRSSGCRVWDENDREYLDYIMGLGSVALGYGHPEVTRAAIAAIKDGVVGPLAPVLEEELAARISGLMPWVEQIRFLKTGAEAMAAAVRLARVATGRDRILGCGYHGWLDWCQSALGYRIPHGTCTARFRSMMWKAPDSSSGRPAMLSLRCPSSPSSMSSRTANGWPCSARDRACRGAADRGRDQDGVPAGRGRSLRALRHPPDLVVMGKALANGFPLAAVGGSAAAMAGVTRTWISSTLATEFVSLAAARATLDVMVAHRVPQHLGRMGARLQQGLVALQQAHPDVVTGVGGIPEMCFLQYADEASSRAITASCARAGLLFKRSAYNFVSLAHDEPSIDQTLAVLAEALSTAAKPA